MLHQMVKVGNAVEYSIELVVVGEDMCVFENLFKITFYDFCNVNGEDYLKCNPCNLNHCIT